MYPWAIRTYGRTRELIKAIFANIIICLVLPMKIIILLLIVSFLYSSRTGKPVVVPIYLFISKTSAAAAAAEARDFFFFLIPSPHQVTAASAALHRGRTEVGGEMGRENHPIALSQAPHHHTLETTETGK